MAKSLLRKIRYEGKTSNGHVYPFSLVGSRNLRLAARQFHAMNNFYAEHGEFYIRVAGEEEWTKFSYVLDLHGS